MRKYIVQQVVKGKAINTHHVGLREAKRQFRSLGNAGKHCSLMVDVPCTAMGGAVKLRYTSVAQYNGGHRPDCPFACTVYKSEYFGVMADDDRTVRQMMDALV